MKNKITAALLIIITLVSLTGCTLAKPDAGPDEANVSGDRLIGIFVTTEYLDLFDFESYFNDNAQDIINGGEISASNSEKYSGRLYAVLKKKELTDPDTGEKHYTREYEFDTVDGISYFSATIPETEEESCFVSTGSDPRISDGNAAFSMGDNEDKIALEGTIYVTPELAGHSTFYFNPVYQSADGSVYAVSGNGFSQSGDMSEGMSHTTTISKTTSLTQDGVTKSFSCEVKMSVAVMYPPNKIVVSQMDENSGVIFREEYTPGNLPDTIITNASTEYIIVETYKTDFNGNAVTSRELYNRDTSSEHSITTFYADNSGICLTQWTSLEWSNGTAEDQGTIA